MSKNGGNQMELGQAIDERPPDTTPVVGQFRQRFERKFFVVPRNIGFAYALLRHVCRAASEYPEEQINSLYFDTFDLDQHERSAAGEFKKDKVRIRWYGDNGALPQMVPVFVELKSRQGFAGSKQRERLLVSAEDLRLDRLGAGIVGKTTLMDTLARFGHFPGRPLRPIILVSYWRYRFTEILTGIRVALDCRIRSTMVLPGSGNGEKELRLPGGVIEVKGQSIELPVTLMRMRLLDIDWTRFSKYSACIDSHTEGLGSVGRVSPSGRIIQP
jgi:hypothetical protein